MTQEEKQKEMALFMGIPEDEIQCEDWCGCNVMVMDSFICKKVMIAARYNTSYDWLMPVWFKLSKITEIYEFPADEGAEWYYTLQEISQMIPQCPIQDVFHAISHAINWFNNISKPL